MDEHNIGELLLDKGIIRNKLKINAAIKNTRAILQMKEEYGSLAKYLQNFIPSPIMHHPETVSDVPVSNELSQRISTQMKKYGFFLVGRVIIYS